MFYLALFVLSAAKKITPDVQIESGGSGIFYARISSNFFPI